MTTQIPREEAAYNHYAHFAKYLILVNRDNPVNTDYVEKNFHLVESQIEDMPSIVLDRLANGHGLTDEQKDILCSARMEVSENRNIQIIKANNNGK